MPHVPQAQPEFFSPQTREARRFYLDLSPPAATPLAVVCGGYESCTPDYAIHRATFPYYSLELVARGRGSLRLGSQSFDLAPGAVFSYGPGVAHDIATSRDEPLEKYFVDFTGRRAARLLTQHRFAPGSFAEVPTESDLQYVFEWLIRDGARGSSYVQPLCTALLEYIIVRIADSLVPSETRPARAMATYLRCRDYITQHFADLRSVDEVVDRCGIDQAYLCRLFRRFDHQTPYRYLVRLKMNWAAERLRDPQVLVKQVAAEAGYEDPFHFSRTFKNVFGISPEAFRRLRQSSPARE
jgi:AraC-like DNA-binding protein